jgi:PPOX class probable F420-dependent enzyme
MPTALTPEVKQLIDRPNFAHLASLMSDGSPQSVPVWVGREGDRLVICTGENSLKGKNTRRDPRVALAIVDFANPYEEVQIRGRVVERRPDPDWKTHGSHLAQINRKALPHASPEGRVALTIDVEKVRYTKLPFEHRPPK